MSIRTETIYFITCENCGEEIGHCDSEKQVRDIAVGIEKWKQIDGKDYCQNCAWKIERKADER